jgi:hypothetical protein
MIEKEPGPDWRDLQRRVAAILTDCGLDAEIGKRVRGARGAGEIDVWAIDAKATPPTIYVCECKRWNTRVPQGAVQAFRTVVGDAGAHHGLFVSAKGFQKGAYDWVKHTNVQLVDWAAFQEIFLDRWCREFWIPTFRSRADRLAGQVDPSISDAGVAEWHAERALTEEEAVGLMALSMWNLSFWTQSLNPLGKKSEPISNGIWALRDRYKPYLPKLAAQTAYLRELLGVLLATAET